MHDMMEFAYFLGGVIVSWVITHFYYKRSAKAVPDWAKPLTASLPDAPVSPEKLIQLYHKALEAGGLTPDAYSGYVVCPNCGAPSSQFQYRQDYGRDDRYLSVI